MNYSSASSRSSRPPQHGIQTKARVKWFSAEKGFGFVAPVDGSSDAFLHVSALQKLGLGQVAQGAEVLCEIGQGQRGPQVVRVIEVGDTDRTEPAGGEIPLSGEVKWFAADKGFGFILADDGGRDVFVHKSVLRRCGLDGLDEGQRVQVTASTTAKGREATWIEVE